MSVSQDAAIEATHINYLEEMQFQHRVMVKWLQGYSLSNISISEGVSMAVLTRALNIKREELKESQEATIDLLVAERIGGLRQIQQEAHEYLEFWPDKAASLLTVALRAEETVAKIQGVLSEKVLHLGRIQHEVKLYDFNDSTPPMIIDGSSVTIEEPELPPIEEITSIEYTTMQEVKVIPPKVAKAVVIKVMRGGYVDFE